MRKATQALTQAERGAILRWRRLADEVPLAGSVAERELIATVEDIIAARVGVAVEPSEHDPDLAPPGDWSNDKVRELIDALRPVRDLLQEYPAGCDGHGCGGWEASPIRSVFGAWSGDPDVDDEAGDADQLRDFGPSMCGPDGEMPTPRRREWVVPVTRHQVTYAVNVLACTAEDARRTAEGVVDADGVEQWPLIAWPA